MPQAQVKKKRGRPCLKDNGGVSQAEKKKMKEMQGQSKITNFFKLPQLRNVPEGTGAHAADQGHIREWTEKVQINREGYPV